MIEIITGTLEEQIIRLLQKTYPITIADIQKEIHVPQIVILRILKKFQTRRIIRLEPLPGKIYIRLLRTDFNFIGEKHQKRNKKQAIQKNKKTDSNQENGIMYS